MKFGRKACYFFHSGVLLFWQNSRIPELRPEYSAECTGTECNGILLFGRHCLFVAHLLPNKHKTNVCLAMAVTTLITTTTLHRHRLPPLMPPPFITTATVTNCAQ
jgi:hypothetical protein